jgi:hypothetical protein
MELTLTTPLRRKDEMMSKDHKLIRELNQRVEAKAKKAARGLFQKYAVSRTDGKDAPGERHHGCKLFVLDITHDLHARAAAAAYAKSCRYEYPTLAADLLLQVREAEQNQEG